MSDSNLTVNEILQNALNRAVNGGGAGAMAMVLNVFTLMWLRTTMNYQYKHGISFNEALDRLYKEGGVRRFYQGLSAALIQAPLSRFGDTAANTGALQLLNDLESTRDMSVIVKTFFASCGASVWRIFLSPVDAVKTNLQVNGNLDELKRKIGKEGVLSLYDGCLLSAGSTLVGHFPWFMTFNQLDTRIPQAKSALGKLIRSAFIGFLCSLISDTCSNFLKVLKTTVQTGDKTYSEAIKEMYDKDGIYMLTRGLKTKLLSNALSSIMFSIMWKYFEAKLNEPAKVEVKYTAVPTEEPKAV